ncbi:rhomboid family intramembrane serine protease [Chryseobacterium taihuense]|uniref:Membrane associated serine protease, rhomboid family n=1 Tax=Chryseobacterium taihuense TaxID=1141221 RepID=A0ABY0QXV9_9FLAO|nr:rhomboid family intramembrane serine protease [Chryseobacterium taihuense]SDM07988.1 Membrane associated serine protease, rhomboid family [Chryseobacterium taihuense]
MFNNIPPITKNIIILNIVVFIAVTLLNSNEVYGYLYGFYPSSPYFHSWQIVTHMFMHGSFMHILFNMFTLFSFGPILEQRLGDKKFVILYFLSGLGAFFLFNLWNLIEVEQIKSTLDSFGFDINGYLAGESVQFKGNSEAILEQQGLLEKLKSIIYTPMVGASGAIFGIIAAFATLYPDAKIGIMFIPVPIKVKILLPIIIVGSVILGVTGNVGGIAHLAHVGGAIVGYILAKIWKKHLYRFN